MAERIASKRGKRIMQDFRITELSAVDRPAQAHAKQMLMKRADDRQEADDMSDMRIEKIGGDEVASFPSFEAAMAHIRKARGLSESSAMSAAAAEHPDLLEKYQQEGSERVAKAAAGAQERTDPAILAFNAAVLEAEHQFGCSRSEAMSRVRAARPDLYASFQAVTNPRVPSGRGPMV